MQLFSGIKKIRLVLTLTILMNLLSADWPDYLEKWSKSLCIIEYYEFDVESNEIKDQARFKRKITGILVNAEGLVITTDVIFPANLDIIASNLYPPVIQKPPEDITVFFEREHKLKAKLVGKDDELRLVFLQLLELENVPQPVLFDTSASQVIGDKIYIIEHLDGRFNYEKIITEHHINSVIKEPVSKLLTTNGSNPLSPGGLVIDNKGNAIGIVCPEVDFLPFEIDRRGGSNIIEILPAKNFTRLIGSPPELTLQKERSGKSWLGIRMQILTSDMAKYWGIEGVPGGIVINAVLAGSPAEKAGLQIGDIITSIGDLNIVNDDKKNLEIFRNYVRQLPQGKEKIRLLRDGKPLTVPIYLTSAPRSQFFAEEFIEETLGIRVKELTQDIIIQNDLDFDTEGIWVSGVEEAGPASIAGLEVNDLIMGINNMPVKNISDFKNSIHKEISSGSEYMQFFINRNSKTQFIFIKIPIKDVQGEK
jgi:S1-C subfamily serine protease